MEILKLADKLTPRGFGVKVSKDPVLKEQLFKIKSLKKGEGACKE